MYIDDNIANTARAPFDEKIRLLYLFFEEDLENGIEFKQFVKMVHINLCSSTIIQNSS